MKSRTLKSALSILFFLILIAIFAAVSRPIYKGITRALETYETKYLNLLSQQTGFSLRYKSLSPSLITGIRLKNVEVYEKATGDSLLNIRKIVVKYDFSKLIKKDFENAFTKIVINDVTFSYDSTENQSVANHLNKIIGSDKEEDVGKSKLSTPVDYLDYVKNLIFMLPQDVLVRNFNGTFNYEGYSVSACLETLSFVHESTADSIATKVSGWACSKMPFLHGDTLGLTFDLNAHLFERLEESSIFITLNDYSPADYSVRKMEFLLRYSDTTVFFSSIQQALPYNLNILYDFSNQDTEVEFSTSDLNPFNLVKIPKQSDFIEKLNGTRFTLDGGLKINLNTLDYTWKTTGSASISKKITPEGEWVNFSLNGDNSVVNADYLNAWGTMFKGSFNGSLELESLTPQAFLSVEHFKLYNNNLLSFDAYLDSYKDNYNLFIPQFYINEKYFTALQLDATRNGENWSFTFDASDYSHLFNDEPGNISIEGDFYTGSQNYMAGIVHFSNEFGDSILDTISLLVKDSGTVENLHKVGDFLKDFVLSADVYVSSNLHSITYNAPNAILANTAKERQIVIASVDGTNRDINLSQVDILYGNFVYQGTANYSFFREAWEDNGHHSFGVDGTLNSIPYRLTGGYHPRDYFNISGNYGIDLSVSYDNGVNGTFTAGTMPFVYKDFSVILSTDLAFDLEKSSLPLLQKDFELRISNFELQETGSKLSFEPKVAFSGQINNSGVFLNSVSYSDSESSLSGECNATWEFADSMLQNVAGVLNLENTIRKEKVSLDGSFSQQKEYGSSEVNRYVDLFADVTGFNMGRFLNGQNEDDILNVKANITGSTKNPSIIVDLARLTLNIAGSPLTVRGDINLDMIDEEEWDLSASNVGVTWKGAYLSGLSGNMELTAFEGLLDGTLGADFLQKNMEMPLTIAIETLEKGRGFIPESFSVVADSKGLTNNLYGLQVPFHLEVIKAPGVLMVRSDEHLGLSGYYMTDSGTIQASITEDKPLHFNLYGNLNNAENTFDAALSSFYFDASRFSGIINTSFFSIYSGILEGDIEASGLQSDPEFSGYLNLANVDFNLPNYVKDHFKLEEATVYLSGDTFSLPMSHFTSKDSGADISAELTMDRWTMNNLDVKFKSFGDKGINVDTKVSLLRIKGRFDADVSVGIQDRVVSVSGDVYAKNTEISILEYSDIFSRDKSVKSDKDEKEEEKRSSRWGIQTDLKLNVGEKVQFIINPIVRGMVAPGTVADIVLDTESGYWNVKGDVVLRGGEITYLSRNFYLKEGRIILDENQNSFDPMITVRAETRERDDSGENVTIVLSAVRQRLSMFRPTLYANPAKSEAEIYELLGQVALADSSNVSGLLIAGVDYGVQVTVVRKLESALRDLFNFDIFSLRTTVLQNAIKQGLNINSTNNNSFGNYFDNTTVYIGKYIGSSVYMDAMLLWTFDGQSVESGDSKTGIVFHPELGVEFAAPFADIRWSFAPDLGNLQETLVSGTSITLSWRINF